VGGARASAGGYGPVCKPAFVWPPSEAGVDYVMFLEAAEVLYAIAKFVDLEALAVLDPEMHGRLVAWVAAVDVTATAEVTAA